MKIRFDIEIAKDTARSGTCVVFEWELIEREGEAKDKRGKRDEAKEREEVRRGWVNVRVRGEVGAVRYIQFDTLERASKISAAKEVSGYRPVGSGQ